MSYKEKIITDRLVLRKLKKEDAEAMFRNWCSDPEMTKYISWTAHKNVEVTKSLVNLWVEEYKDPNTVRFIITLKDSDEPIGSIDVVKYVNDSPEIGYCLSRKYWNQGYMSEACKALIDYLFELGYPKILIRADERNIASNRVIEKCGFTFINKERAINRSEEVTLNCYELQKSPRN